MSRVVKIRPILAKCYYRSRGVDATHTRKGVQDDIALQRQIPEREMDKL